MDKAERAKLLRQRFKAQGGVCFFGDSGKPAKPAIKRRIVSVIPFGEVRMNTVCAPLWLKHIDPQRKVPLNVRRIARVSPLVRIAERYFTRKRRH
jgi:hypothetical protein